MRGGLTPMAAADARACVAEAMTLRERIADVARFAVRPTYAAPPMAWGQAAALALLLVFALGLALDWLVAALTEAWDARASFLPEPLVTKTTLAQDVIEFLVLAPVLEELAFRGWLTGRIAALRFALYGFAAMLMFGASLVVPGDYALPAAWCGAGIAFAGLIHWGLTHRRDTAVPAWFTRHFAGFVWGSTAVFGLIHLGNYTPIQHPLGLLIVLPHTIGGLLLAYVRTRLGLGAAMAHHAAYNAVFLAGAYGWW